MFYYIIYMSNCIICNKILTGRQTKFCCLKCKNLLTNNKHQVYESQQNRGVERKNILVNNKGGKCQICGYNKNYAALSFHHRDPKQKKFPLDLRNCSNHSWKKLIIEAEKCDLLCLCCHVELHNPRFEQ